jgi:hypothetical protein
VATFYQVWTGRSTSQSRTRATTYISLAQQDHHWYHLCHCLRDGTGRDVPVHRLIAPLTIFVFKKLQTVQASTIHAPSLSASEKADFSSGNEPLPANRYWATIVNDLGRRFVVVVSICALKQRNNVTKMVFDGGPTHAFDLVRRRIRRFLSSVWICWQLTLVARKPAVEKLFE